MCEVKDGPDGGGMAPAATEGKTPNPSTPIAMKKDEAHDRSHIPVLPLVLGQASIPLR